MKKSFETGGPLVFAVAWLVLAGGAYGRWLWVTPFSVWTLLVGMAMGGGAGILLFRAAGSLRRQKNSVHARVNIWSSARPGEVMVGVLHTGTERRDPAGLVLNLDCLEQNSGGQWLLWSSQVCSPAPTGPDAWPFHFSIPLEGPPSGPSTDGHVVWQLRAKSVSLPIFEARFDVVVARVAGPPSHLLPVPPPRFGKGTAPRRSVVLIEQPGQRVLRLGSRFAFPGQTPWWCGRWAGWVFL
ncbi:MAG: hypothetical protein IPN90_04150 [Elusimicrobia bacterium]|nr:hypothetical protein [Elusimicrobiota bacterium]